MQGLEGIFKCYDHNESFNDIDEFNAHCASEAHQYTGTNRCQDCGEHNIPINYKGTLEPGKSAPAICKKCEDAYIEELVAKGKVKKA